MSEKQPSVFILVRHSLVLRKPAMPAAAWRLSDKGRARCLNLAAKLHPYHVTRFVTSEEAKAVETGRIIAQELDVPCQTVVNLHEHDRLGVPYFERQEDFHTAVANFFSRPYELVLGNETAVQARTRFDTAVHLALATYANETVAVVAHGTVMTLFVNHYNPTLACMSFWQQLTMPCAIVLTWPDFQFVTRIDV